MRIFADRNTFICGVFGYVCSGARTSCAGCCGRFAGVGGSGELDEDQACGDRQHCVCECAVDCEPQCESRPGDARWDSEAGAEYGQAGDEGPAHRCVPDAFCEADPGGGSIAWRGMDSWGQAKLLQYVSRAAGGRHERGGGGVSQCERCACAGGAPGCALRDGMGEEECEEVQLRYESGSDVWGFGGWASGADGSAMRRLLTIRRDARTSRMWQRCWTFMGTRIWRNS
jgi:hypothetical protein